MYTDLFWEEWRECAWFVYLCVKVICLVDGYNLAMVYFHEAMDRTKQAIQSDYFGKSTLVYEKIMMFWILRDQ